MNLIIKEIHYFSGAIHSSCFRLTPEVDRFQYVAIVSQSQKLDVTIDPACPDQPGDGVGLCAPTRVARRREFYWYNEFGENKQITLSSSRRV